MSTRRIFVNVLVNGAPYQNKVAIDIPIDSKIADTEYAQDILNEINVTDHISLNLLTYEIVNEVTEKQSKTLLYLLDCLELNKAHKCQLRGSGDMCEFLDMDIPSMGIITIRAKDIVIKE